MTIFHLFSEYQKMCGRFFLLTPMIGVAEEYALNFAEQPIEKEINPRFNISPKSKIPVILEEPTVHSPTLKQMQWGVVFNEKYGLTFNVRAENLQSSPAWKNPFLHKRCLIPANGFIEWQEIEGTKKTQPWNIHKPNNELFSFAGIYNFFPDKISGKLELCTFIITTEANPKMKTIHNKGGNKFRQPAIIDKSNYTAWLDSTNTNPENIFPLLKQFSDDEFNYTELEKVGDDVNRTPPLPKGSTFKNEEDKKETKKKKKTQEQFLF